MYITHSLQVKDLVQNVIKIIEKEQGRKIEIAFQSEASFQIDEERRILYENFNRNEEFKRFSNGRRKVSTIYTYPCFRNQVDIHLLSYLSVNPKAKYLTDGCQKRFFPTPGA